MMQRIGRMAPAILKRSLKASLVILMCLIAASCGKDDLQGTIVSKQIKPGYDFLYMMPTYSTSCSGNPTTCTTYQSGMIPIWYHVPTCYQLTVDGDKSGSTCVDESVWNEMEPGDYYEGPDVDPKDRKVKK